MDEQKQDQRHFLIGSLAFFSLFAVWTWALIGAPSEKHMGEVYRILYVHVPVAFTAFFTSFLLLIFSLYGLFKKSENSLLYSRSCAEVGLIFTILTLATGSIWGKPTWGVWWTWDARLTTTFILALLYAGYLILFSTLPSGPGRIRVCSALGIIIAADIPIIYKSVSWWRTLHQPPSIMREGGSTMDDAMLIVVFISTIAVILCALWLIWPRTINLLLEEEIDRLTYQQMKGDA